MALTRTLILTLVAGIANGIALSQSVASPGNLTLNGSLVVGGTAIFDVARRVQITDAGNDSGITFTVTGTDRYGRTQTETLAGGNAAAVFTQRDFLTVTQIAVSGATASTVTAGTNGVGSSQPYVMDEWANPAVIGFGISVTGTATYNIEAALDDFSAVSPIGTFWDLNINLPTWFTIVNGSAGASEYGPVAGPFSLVRLTVTSGTGTVTARLIQPFNAGS